MSLQKIVIEGQPVGAVYCPMCGAKWDFGVSSKRPCAHFIFAYIADISHFIGVDSRLRVLVKKAMTQEEDTPIDALLASIDSKTQVCLEFVDIEAPAQALAGSLYIGVDCCPPGAEEKVGHENESLFAPYARAGR